MLDINLYRENENIAMRDLDTWQKRSRHSLEVFEKAGFPVRVDNISLLRQIFSTMSEGLYTYFMKELGGLSDDELEMFIEMAVSAAKFQATHFPNKPQIIPLENILKDILIFSRIKNVPHGNILEIGPGCGTFAYIFSGMPDVVYHQAEACESFYMLNHYQNMFLYGEEFEQLATFADYTGSSLFIRSDNASVIESPQIVLPKTEKRCVQYPWWRLGEIQGSEINYDLVMSHANLMEFSHDALYDYLTLIGLKLKKDGLFVVNCYGNPSNRNNHGLFDSLYKYGFAPLFMHHTSVLVPSGQFKSKKLLLVPAGDDNRALASDSEFVNKFSEVILLDDNRAGSAVGGCRVIGRKEVDEYKFDFALVNSTHKNVEEEFRNFLKSKNIQEFDGEKYRPAKSWGIFVYFGHELHEKYYSRSNFMTYFNSNEEIVKKFFSKSVPDKKREYQKEELLGKINEKIKV